MQYTIALSPPAKAGVYWFGCDCSIWI